MRAAVLRGTGVAVLFWFAFAAAIAKVRGGTVPLDRCLHPEPEWSEETGEPLFAAPHHGGNRDEARPRWSDHPGHAGWTDTPADVREELAATGGGSIQIPLPAPLLTGTVGMIGVATALLLRRAGRAG